MDRIQLTESIIAIVNGIINDDQYKVIIADQSAPRPSNPYGTVKIITSLQETLESTSYGDAAGYLSSSQQKVMVSFNFYKDGSFDIASLVRKALWRNNVNDLLQEIGLGISYRRSVENLTESLEAVFEERANFICLYNYVEVDYDAEYVQGMIEKANIHGIVQEPSGDIPIEIQIEQS